MTFNLLTPKSIGVFLSLSSVCLWSIKFVGWEIVELLHYSQVLWPMWKFFKSRSKVTWSLTFWPRIYRCLPFTILYLCMKFVGWEIVKLLHYIQVWTDGQSDYYRAPASSMAGRKYELGNDNKKLGSAFKFRVGQATGNKHFFVWPYHWNR